MPRRVAFYFYEVPDPRRPGKTRRTPCRYSSENPPRNGVPIESTVEWRDVPETPEEAMKQGAGQIIATRPKSPEAKE